MAAARKDTTIRVKALDNLCRSYWQPLYLFVRRRGHNPQDAKDLVQGFFLKLMEKNYLNKADTSKGRFRSFLLTALKGFLANEYDRGQAKKRGGGTNAKDLEIDLAERLC